MRRCKLVKCAKRGGNPCCADCDDKTCLNRCRNSPERCKCVSYLPPQRKAAYDHEAIYQLVLKGLTYDQVADRIGCAPSTVGKVAREYGLFRPGRGRRHGGN